MGADRHLPSAGNEHIGGNLQARWMRSARTRRSFGLSRFSSLAQREHAGKDRYASGPYLWAPRKI